MRARPGRRPARVSRATRPTTSRARRASARRARCRSSSSSARSRARSPGGRDQAQDLPREAPRQRRDHPPVARACAHQGRHADRARPRGARSMKEPDRRAAYELFSELEFGQLAREFADAADARRGDGRRRASRASALLADHDAAELEQLRRIALVARPLRLLAGRARAEGSPASRSRPRG